MMNEKQCRLIERAKQGDEDAFAQLYSEFYRLAYFFAFKLCRNEADAKDVLQDTFVEIQRSISSLKETTYFKAWLYKIVHSKCKKLFRKNKYTTTDFEKDPIIGNMQEQRMEFTPEFFAHFRSDQEVLRSCIDQLPLTQREIILLFYIEQMSIKEIADILDVPIGTVKSRLSYGRNYLREMLEEYHSAQGEPLTFRSLDGLAASVLMNELARYSVQVPKLANAGILRFRSLSQSALMQAGAVVLSASLVCGGRYLFVKSSSEQEVQRKNSRFHVVMMRNEAVTSAQDAYFTLISWACCPEMIQEKPHAEILQAQQAYAELKAHGGIYYDQLVNQHWSDAYEQRLNEH